MPDRILRPGHKMVIDYLTARRGQTFTTSELVRKCHVSSETVLGALRATSGNLGQFNIARTRDQSPGGEFLFTARATAPPPTPGATQGRDGTFTLTDSQRALQVAREMHATPFDDVIRQHEEALVRLNAARDTYRSEVLDG